MPQLAALFHNDCSHVAGVLLSLPYCLAPGLQQLAGGNVTFAQAAMQLRDSGKGLLKDALVRQQQARVLRADVCVCTCSVFYVCMCSVFRLYVCVCVLVFCMYVCVCELGTWRSEEHLYSFPWKCTVVCLVFCPV